MLKVIKQYFVRIIKKILGIKSPSKLEDLVSPTYPSTLEGRILLFDTVNKNGAVFSKDCKIDISKKGWVSMFGSENRDDFDVVNATIGKIAHQIQETEDEFIFKTLSDFAYDNYNIVVEKQELIQAIDLIRMYREAGFDIGERFTTATQQSEWYRHAYDKGLKDGIKKEHDRIIGILNNFNKEDSNE